jgi:serine/threonine protein phosphatase PrpC
LWAIGPNAAAIPVGTRINERYQVVQPQLWLDLHPSRSPIPLEQVPAIALPYLSLSPWVRAMPRPFTHVSTPQGDCLLLEDIPVQVPLNPTQAVTLLPSLAEAWGQASALHQLAWLWQVAQLWEPCQGEGVAASLLRTDLVRVDGGDVRLLALENHADRPKLEALGLQWRGWVKTAQPPLQPYLDALTEALSAGQLSPAALLASLTQALEQLTAGVSAQVKWVAYSDQGPTRQRNEDACYPASGDRRSRTMSSDTLSPQQPAPLVVVCDGIGGHQGGDVASKLAIEVVTEQLTPILQTPHQSHEVLVQALEQAVLTANQRLSEANDQSQRQARDRMGTTLVIAAVYGARFYLAHLGDSRAYQIRSQSCRQITLDDDVAVRESRLGYALYRDALLNPGSGSLVQALGMGDSQYLRPTVQMQVIAEESLWLICSDGLSDHDLVLRLWTPEILPALTGQAKVDAVAQQLIQLANTHNGHDNVTVGLLRATPRDRPPLPTLPATLAQPEASQPAQSTAPKRPPSSPGPAPSPSPTATATRSWRPIPMLLAAFLIAALGGGGAALIWRGLSLPEPTPSTAEAPSPGTALSPAATPPTPANGVGVSDLSVGEAFQVQQLPPSALPESGRLTLVPEIPVTPAPAAVGMPQQTLPIGSIVQVVTRQKTPDNQLWVQLKVCSLPSTEGRAESPSSSEVPSPVDAPEVAPVGYQGWILEAEVRSTVRQLASSPSSGTDAPCP